MIFNLVRLFLAVFLSAVFCLPVYAADAEKLEYDVTWFSLPVGSAVVEMRDLGSQYQFSLKARTSKLVSFVYEIDDSMEAVNSKSIRTLQKKVHISRLPLRSRKIFKEGKYRVDEELNFDPSARRVTVFDRIRNEKTVLPFEKASFDLLSSFFYLRQMRLEAGKTVQLQVLDNKRLYRIEVFVLRKETLKTALGSYKTIVIRPVINIFGLGVMYLPGDLTIWLTDDERRIPLLIEKKIIIPPGVKLPEILKPGIEAAVGLVKVVLSKGL